MSESRVVVLDREGHYNCHGLVFGSRRTNIPALGMDDNMVIREILKRDGYTQTSEPSVGDVITYLDGSTIIHTGIVVEVPLTAVIGSTVRIWSMWGATGEFLHPVSGSPYGHKYSFWRIPHEHPR